MKHNTTKQFNDYISWVKNNPDKTCRQIRQLVDKHEQDLSRIKSTEYPYWFQLNLLEPVLWFFNNRIKHAEGGHAGKPFILSTWQVFLLGMIFCWVDADNHTRRYRRVYLQVARKNGKTSLAAAIALYMLLEDDEPAAQIYSAATKRDQARLLFDASKRMIAQEPKLNLQVKTTNWEIRNDDTFSKFSPLSSEGNTLDGLNVSAAFLDELAQHRDDSVYNVIDTATGARRQPLLISITTAGSNKTSFCYQLLDLSNKLLNNEVQDDRFLPVIYQLDKEDDWDNPDNLIKANPNLDVSITKQYLLDQLEKAKALASFKYAFLTKHVNIWTDTFTMWVNAGKWQECHDPDYTLDDVLKCKKVYIGLDLSSKLDLTSIAVLGQTDDKYLCWSFNFLPQAGIDKLKLQSTMPIQRWIDEGFITIHAGETINYNEIKVELLKILNARPDAILAYDAWGANQITHELSYSGYQMLTVRQGYVTMSPAMKKFEEIYVGGHLKQPNNLALNSAMYSLVAEQDPAGNIKPNKAKAIEKIDPAVALIIAIAGTLATEAEEIETSIKQKQHNTALDMAISSPIMV